MKRVEERLTSLELRLLPPEPWIITACYSDGREIHVDAETYKRIKLNDPKNIFVTDRRLTGSLKELSAWLDMIYELAALETDEVMEI